MDTAEITNRLKAADPTMVMGPSSPGTPSRSPRTPDTERMISGAEEPRAIKVKLAMVGFQTGLSIEISYPSVVVTVTVVVFDVMVSIASMKMSATRAIPRNK